MNTNLSRGVVAALIGLTSSAVAGAQVSAGSISPARARGDSVVIRAFGAAKLDTISVLFRALEHEEYGSPAWVGISRKLDSLVMSSSGRVMIRAKAPGMLGPSEEVMPRGWVGFNAQGPSQISIDNDGYRVTYFAYPSILSVDPESPADRAGIAPGDVLVAFNGTDVVGREFNLTRLFVPEKKVGVTIRKSGGETRDYSLEVVKAPEGVFSRRLAFTRIPTMRPMPPMPPDGVMRIDIDRTEVDRSEAAAQRAAARAAAGAAAAGSMTRHPAGAIRVNGPLMGGSFAIITPHGVFGADVSPVGPELAKVLKLEKGVLVNVVPDQSPAFKAGLRAGDVIISASGQPVVTLDELQNQIVNRFGERSVTLQIMRDRKPSKVTVTW